jgi:WD40 repeat protein
LTARELRRGGWDGIVHLWESAGGKHVRALVLGDSFPCQVRSVAFARHGKTLAAGGQDRKAGQDRGVVRIWDTTSGEHRLESRTGQDVAKVALSNDGNKLAVATSSFSEFREKTRSGARAVAAHHRCENPARSAKESSWGGYVRALAFSPTGATIIAVERSGSLRTWDVATGRLTGSCDVCGRVVSRRPDGVFFFGCDPQLVARWQWSIAFPATLPTLWDLTKGKQIGHVNLENESNLASVVAISPDNRVIASASWGGEDRTPEKHSLRLWDARTGQLLKRYSRPLSNRVASWEFTPDGRRLISGMSDGSSLIWDASGL